ncbi:MAG: PEP-CTERM sorting domain-containing protein [Terriglobia bacterium]
MSAALNPLIATRAFSCLWAFSIVGQGTITVFGSLGETADVLQFTFEQPASTPEPATLWLVFLGLARSLYRLRNAQPA